MANLLGIDVGTSAVKAIVIEERGAVLSTASVPMRLSTPQPAWTEQSPADWWAGTEECLSQLSVQDWDAIGLTGQMHGSVFLDAEGDVIRPALLWNDQRTARQCLEIETAVGAARLKELTGNPALTGFQLPKILWLRDNEPEAFARLHRVLLPKDYIRFKLTGELATDVSDGSGVGALDVRTRDWSEEILASLGLSRDLLPPVVESQALTGRTRMGCPVGAGAGDQAAGAVGAGAIAPGVVSVSLGTSGVVFSALPQLAIDPTGATHVFCHANGGWHAMGVTLSCGGSVRWFRDSFAPGSTYEELTGTANGTMPGSEGLLFLPYLSGERCPLNDPNVRGAFLGETLSHGFSHHARAVFEGVTFSLHHAFEALENLGVHATELRVCGGGSRSPFWLNLLADVFGVPCAPLLADEGPSFGAALLAGVGVGTWSSIEEAVKVVQLADCLVGTGADYSPFETHFRRASELVSALGSQELA